MKLKGILLGSLLIAGSGFSQDFSGLRESNYAGVMGADLNPANIADNRMKFDMTIVGLSSSAYNNRIYFNPHLMPYGWKKSFDYTDVQSFNWLKDPTLGRIISADSTDHYMNKGLGNLFQYANPKDKPTRAAVNVNVDILNLMFKLPGQMAGGFQIKQRTMVNVDHVAQELVTLGMHSLKYPDLWNKNLDDQLLNISVNSWVEYNLLFAKVIKDDNEHFVKAGAKLKFLQGLGAAYIYTDRVDYNLMNNDTANQIKGHFNYGYSANLADLVEPNNPLQNQIDFSNIFGMQSRLGMGLDIGGVYEWRPDYKDYKYNMNGETDLWMDSKNKYKAKVSVAINDIGGLRYAKGNLSKDFEINANAFDLHTFDNVSGFKSFDSVLIDLEAEGKIERVSDKGTFYMNLPTNININGDYHIAKDFYANMGFVYGIQRKKDASKVHYASSITVAPRYDHRWFGAAIPVSYSGIAKARVGLGLRMGPLMLATGDLKPFFAAGKDKKLNGADFSLALRIPIFYTHPKDMDKDEVSDDVDACKEIAGTWKFKGCPDSDQDGIEDKADKCPLVAGLPEFEGCPDTDGDKIIDDEDDCPEIAGLAQFKGCPDKDSDGVMDKEDDCPEVAGLLALKGCPDTDGDGIKDEEDLCPEHAGPVENQGCPDTDADGIFDYLDGCPEQSGPKENNGCPWPDTDGDGLLDKDDKCPNNPGPAKNDGCPYIDTDGDGVLDKDDDCVNTPGTVANKGCPEIQEEEQEIINTAFENLEFMSGKAIIKESSFASLEGLADLLVKKDNWKLLIAGHTDNVGNDQNNLVLSKKRAEAVQTFLNQRGVEEKRLIVQFFGEEKPIADNSTEEGRQKNRRVEMTVLFE